MKLWFRARDYGWGWTPVTWQGWAVVLVWFAGVLLLVSRVDDGVTSSSDLVLGYLLPLAVWTVALVIVCRRTGERPSWRWAGKPARPATVVVRIAGIIALGFVIAAALVAILGRR